MDFFNKEFVNQKRKFKNRNENFLPQPPEDITKGKNKSEANEQLSLSETRKQLEALKPWVEKLSTPYEWLSPEGVDELRRLSDGLIEEYRETKFKGKNIKEIKDEIKVLKK